MITFARDLRRSISRAVGGLCGDGVGDRPAKTKRVVGELAKGSGRAEGLAKAGLRQREGRGVATGGLAMEWRKSARKT